LPAEWQGSRAGSLEPYLLYDAYKRYIKLFRCSIYRYVCLNSVVKKRPDQAV
jgi:hypothetical protein